MTSACFDWRGMAAAVFATWVGLIRLRGARAGLFCCCLTVLLPARRVCFRGPLVFAVPALADLFIRTSSGIRRRLAPSLPEAPPTRPVRAVAPGGSEHVAGGMGMDALYEREVQSIVQRTAQPRGGLAACGISTRSIRRQLADAWARYCERGRRGRACPGQRVLEYQDSLGFCSGRRVAVSRVVAQMSPAGNQ